MLLEIQNSVCGTIPHSVLIRNLDSPSPVFDVLECVVKADGVSRPPPHSAHTIPSLAIMLNHARSRGRKTPEPRGEIERAPPREDAKCAFIIMACAFLIM